MIEIKDHNERTVAVADEKVKLSPPWMTYYRELAALFAEDPEIEHIYFDEDDMVIRFHVQGQDKADALDALLPKEVEFGNVKITISVIPANREKNRLLLLRDAFKGNPVFKYSVDIPQEMMGNPISYFVFTSKIAQFFNDNLHDAHGNKSMLYEDIAREIIGEDDGVFFCTDAINPQAVG